MRKAPKIYFFVFVVPTLICFAIAFLIPFLAGIYLSFCKFTTVTNAKFVGISNYISAFANNDFLNALAFTSKFTIVSVITINVFAFSVAMLLTRAIKGTNIFRTVFFMPNLIGGIVLGYIWQLIINGVLIHLLGVDITYSAKYGFWGLVVVLNWQMIGYMMIIYIAAIQNIPADLLEAAQIDGAKPMQTLFNITIPMVMPAITICTFLTLTNSFKLFDQNFALTGGAPARQSQMLALDIYSTFYSRVGSEGMGQAKAVVFFVIVALIAVVQIRATHTKEIES
jgi:raffinose/stachyose/melibiose transport system permease protein